MTEYYDIESDVGPNLELNDALPEMAKKSEEERYQDERVRVLQEALRVDYIEKFDIYAKLIVTQRELAETTIHRDKLQNVKNLLDLNNKALTKEIVELKGIARDLKAKKEKLQQAAKKKKESFAPSESYVEEEVEVQKPKRAVVKRTRAKKAKEEE
tara:strand:- start:32212 stop:32679 length:468 start_codon:yes stop_codon:yes gene_type:complete